MLTLPLCSLSLVHSVVLRIQGAEGELSDHLLCHAFDLLINLNLTQEYMTWLEKVKRFIDQ